MSADSRFEVRAVPSAAAGETLVVGFSLPGMAGLSAADYLVKHRDFEQIGHVRTRGFPAIAPFEDGTPRHPIRVYADDETELTVLVCELFVPVFAAEAFADGLLDWVGDTDLTDIAVLHGIPYPHGPEGHDVYVTATPEYRERRLDGVDVKPLSGGFLDGIVGELVLRGLEADGVPVGAFITPSHPPGPDLEAALLLLDALQRVSGVSVERDELEQLAARMRSYYGELADRMQSLEEGAVATREYPEDRMFM